MNGSSVSDSTASEQTNARNQHPLQCRRGNPTHPFEPNGWSGRAAPRSPGQPPTRANGDAVEVADKIALRIPAEELEAQAIACTHLVRACRHAMDELRLEGDSNARTVRATEIPGDIQSEWAAALAALRKLSRR